MPMRSRTATAELLILAILSIALSWIAFRVFPAWDDGSIWLMSVEGSSGIIRRSHADRPFFGAILQFLDDRGALWQTAIGVHWLVWFGTACVTRSLWRALFPGFARFALPAACLAIAPVICRTQFILLNPVFGGAVEALLPFLAVLLVWKKQRSTGVFVVCCCLAAILVIGASLLSEYALPAAVCGSVLLVGMDFVHSGRISRQRFVAAGVVIASAAVAYLVYHALASAEARQDVRPEFQLANDLGWRLKGIPLRTISTSWQASLGGVLQRLGDIDMRSYSTALGVVCGLVLAGCLIILGRQSPEARSGESRSIYSARTLAVLVGALLAGILPVVTMGRSVTAEPVTTHYLLPVLPLGACLSVYLLLCLFRESTWWAVAAICGLVAGFFVTVDGSAAIADRDRVASWSAKIEKLVPDSGSDLTVAIFNCDWRVYWQMPRDYELTARLVANWPESKLKRFWAFADLRQGREFKPALKGIDWDGTLQHPEMKTGRLEFARKGFIKRVLWVYVSNKDGTLDIHVAEP